MHSYLLDGRGDFGRVKNLLRSNVQINPQTGESPTPSTHSQFGPVRFTATEIGPWPDSQVASTITRMNQRVLEDSARPDFAARAQRISGNGTELDKVRRLYDHTRQGIRFARDEVVAAGLQGVNPDDVVEVIIRPCDMAQYVDAGVAVGDCDDFSMYLAALLTAIGIPCAFVTVAADERGPAQYSHVYVAAFPDVGEGNGERVRVACDASHGQFVGWEVPNAFGKYKEWRVGTADCGGGLGFVGAVIAGVMSLFGAWWLWREWRGVGVNA